MNKRSFILSVIISLLLTMNVFADTITYETCEECESCGPNCKFIKTGSTIIIYGPTEENDAGAVPIGKIAQKDGVVQSGATNVVISGNIKKLTFRAFSLMRSLDNITIPDTVTEIEKEAFSRTAISSLEIPSSVTKIGENAFVNMSHLTSLLITGDLGENVSDKAFNSTSATVYCKMGSNCEGKGADANLQYYKVSENGHIELLNSDGTLNGTSFSSMNDFRVALGLTPQYQSKSNCPQASDSSPSNLVYKGKMYMKTLDEKGNWVYLDISGNKLPSVKRIYTVEEAEKASKPTGNKFRVRYK